MIEENSAKIMCIIRNPKYAIPISYFGLRI